MNDVFDMVKELTGEQNEKVINYFIEEALKDIVLYINRDEIFIYQFLKNELIKLAVRKLKQKDQMGIKSFSEGGLSITFEDDETFMKKLNKHRRFKVNRKDEVRKSRLVKALGYYEGYEEID